MTNRPLQRALMAGMALGTLVVPWATPSGAQIPPVLGTTTTTTTTDPGPSSSSTSSSTSTTSTSTTTSTAFVNPVTTSTEPEASSTTTTSTPGQATPEVTVPPVSGGDGSPPVDEALEAQVIPEWAREQMASIQRSAANNTSRVLDMLSPLEAFGFSRAEIATFGLGKFPVAGDASFVDDWWYPRFTPEFHLHEGTDIFAEFGTPLIAPLDAVLTMGDGPVGGQYVYLTDETDGTYYYFAHLDELPDLPDEARITDPEEAARYHFRGNDLPVAYRVEAGDVIGTVGDTGNAKGGAPHLHLEIHPAGGEPVNPKPMLDGWLADAEAAVPDIIALYASRGPKAVIATQRTRAAGTSQFAAPSRPLSAEILGVSAAAGPGTSVQVVTEQVSRALGQIDWTRYEDAQLARPAERVYELLSAMVPAPPRASGAAASGGEAVADHHAG